MALCMNDYTQAQLDLWIPVEAALVLQRGYTFYEVGLVADIH